MKNNGVENLVESMVFFNKLVNFLTDEKLYLSPLINGEIEQDTLIITLSNTLADTHLYGFILYHRLDVLAQITEVDVDRRGDTTTIKIKKTKLPSVLLEVTKAAPSFKL